MLKNLFFLPCVGTITCILTSCSETSSYFNTSAANDSATISPVRAQLNEDAFWRGSPRVIWDRLQPISLSKLQVEPLSPDSTRSAWIKNIIVRPLTNESARLTRLPNFPLYAATGALTLTPSHKIYRRLPTVQIHNGHP